MNRRTGFIILNIAFIVAMAILGRNSAAAEWETNPVNRYLPIIIPLVIVIGLCMLFGQKIVRQTDSGLMVVQIMPLMAVIGLVLLIGSFMSMLHGNPIVSSVMAAIGCLLLWFNPLMLKTLLNTQTHTILVDYIGFSGLTRHQLTFKEVTFVSGAISTDARGREKMSIYINKGDGAQVKLLAHIPYGSIVLGWRLKGPTQAAEQIAAALNVPFKIEEPESASESTNQKS